MTLDLVNYDLVIGDRAYSSWSLRGWLLFEPFGLKLRCHRARLYTDELPRLLAEGYIPGRTAPTLRTAEGDIIPETIAIAEELASRHPEAGIWPSDAAARSVARVLVAEMHAGFGALRNHCPMNLRLSYHDCAPPAAVLEDLARIESLWLWARQKTGSQTRWLCGDYCAADVFFAPIAARIGGHNLPVGPEAQAYVAAHLAHPSFRRWRAMSLVDGADQPVYRRDWPQRPWPGPVPLPARAIAGGEISGPATDHSENSACPYSGLPVTDLMQLNGRKFGFCNSFCRDKTVADPEAWPAFMALLQNDRTGSTKPGANRSTP